MTRWAIEMDRVTIAAVIIIVIGGLVAYFSLPQDEDPGFTIRTALVLTYFPGASPERVENMVSDKIEEAVQEMFLKTSTSTAPWTIVQADDKRAARLQTLATVVDVLENGSGLRAEEADSG